MTDTNNNNNQSNNGDITIGDIVSSFFYIATLGVIIYYLWIWWQNTRRLKTNISNAINKNQKQNENFTNWNANLDGDTNKLLGEIPRVTQSKIPCEVYNNSNKAEGIWDAADDGFITFNETERKWSSDNLINNGDKSDNDRINYLLNDIKNKYIDELTHITKEMLPYLEPIGLKNYISVFLDLDNETSADNQILQIKGMLGIKNNKLTDIVSNLTTLLAKGGNNDLSGAIQDDLIRKIIRIRELREYLESVIDERGEEILVNTGRIYNYLFIKLSNNDENNYDNTIDNEKTIGSELLALCNKLLDGNTKLLPLIDEIIKLRVEYKKEKDDILELLNILPRDGNSDDNDDEMKTNNKQSYAKGINGGVGQIPNDVLGSNKPQKDSGIIHQIPQRYYLNKMSASRFEIIRDLDKQVLTEEEYNNKYEWVDKIGKDKIPVPDDPDINYSRPNNMRTITDILSDYDHYNANCQRIYAECSSRTQVPGFPLPNWDTQNYYDYLDKLPNARDAASGVIPTIGKTEK